MAEPLDIDKLTKIVAAHGKFCKLVSRVAHRGRVMVSFASKYLHFHAPIVPMYDRLAYGQAWRMRSRERMNAFSRPKSGNVDYYLYCSCFWQIYSDLSDAVGSVRVRSAESYLLWLADAEPR
jgi:hypothetical protein